MTNYFSHNELKCPCCDENKFNQYTLNRLNLLRAGLGQPLTLNSAYRCEAYNTKRGFTQTHASGQAVDIKCSHSKALTIVALALKLGFTGIGISQKGNHKKRFIHLDDLEQAERRPRPHIWSY